MIAALWVRPFKIQRAVIAAAPAEGDMQYSRVCIEAISYALPSTVVTTASLESSLSGLYHRMGIAPGAIQSLTGIAARRFWDIGVQPSDAATLAAEKALASFDRDAVEILVSCSVCKDYLEPSTASLVHGNLRLGRQCLNFDIGNACLGFMSGMVAVGNMIELGQIKAGLVVAGEGSRTVTEATIERLQRPGVAFAGYRDNLATLTLGSGSAAMLLVHESIATEGHRLLGGAADAATEFNRLCVGTSTSMKTDPAKLLREGVKLAGQTWERTRSELGLEVGDVQEFALHQVGKANHDSVLQALRLPPNKALRVYPHLGNMGAAGVPLTLAKTIEIGRLTPGNNAALMGIGSGLNCQMMGVAW
jgi:3-oxoacyl-[acyl-carrier-protein] synthase-3